MGDPDIVGHEVHYEEEERAPLVRHQPERAACADAALGARVAHQDARVVAQGGQVVRHHRLVVHLAQAELAVGDALKL